MHFEFETKMAAETDTSLYLEPNVIHTSIPQAILEDLCSRFLINMPEEEQDDMVRVFFQIEQAHWYYVDFYCQEQSLLPTCGLREFTKTILEKFPFINKKGEHMDKLLSNWKKYKFSVPVYGAILLNSELDKCILVQAYTSKSSWGFPRGKLNKDESPLECSIREVLEETGFDITSYVDENHFLESSIHDHLVRLYLVANVPTETEFKARTRGEIKDIQWFQVKDLPVHRKDSRMKEHLGLNPNNFFMVVPFVKNLKKWISEQRNLASLEQQAVQAQPKNQLERLLESENAKLNMENERFEDDKRRHVAQQRFLNQLDFYHPLRPQDNVKSGKGYGTSSRKQAKFPSEHDQKGGKSFKILQRPDTEASLDPDRRNSPVTTRHGSPSSLPPPHSCVQESYPSDSRSLSPSSNSAFTRVSRGNNTSPRLSGKTRPTTGSDTKIVSPSGSRRARKNKLDAKETANSTGFTFVAPAWTNFKFDKAKILAAFQESMPA